MLRLNMVPVKRQKVKAVTVELAKVPACGLTARGLKLSQKAVQDVELLPEAEKPARAAKPAQPEKTAKPSPQAQSKGLLSKASRLAPRTPKPRKKTR